MDRVSLIEALQIPKSNGVESVVFEPRDGGTTIYAIDTERITLVIVEFEENLAKERAFVDLTKVLPALRRIDSDNVTVEINQNKTIIRGGQQEFTLNNINVKNAPQIPNVHVKYENHAIIQKEDLRLFFRAANKISDTFTITMDDMEVILYTSNDDGDEAKVHLLADQLREIAGEKKQTGKYKTKWFYGFVTHTPSEYIEIYLKKNAPILFESKILGNAFSGGYCAKMYVAPVVET